MHTAGGIIPTYCRVRRALEVVVLCHEVRRVPIRTNAQHHGGAARRRAGSVGHGLRGGEGSREEVRVGEKGVSRGVEGRG